MSKRAKQTYFKDAWLTSSEFSCCIARSAIKTEARSKLCKINFDLRDMGVTALKSHSQSIGHVKLVKEKEEISNFFKKKANKTDQTDQKEPEVMEVSTESECSTVIQTTIPSSFQDGRNLNAEIRLCLKHVMSGYSDNSVTDSCELFVVMFPDSKIPSQIELGRMKLKYIVNFGPHFTDVLKCETAASEWYSISFDDSLNKVVQEFEMDILIRFWITYQI